MERLELSVQGMTCKHCVMAVEKALQKIPGVQRVLVDLDAATARVEGEGLLPDPLIHAIEEEGYSARLKA